jgi:hypothetical protein
MEGREQELTGQGREYRAAFSPGETRRKHASIVLQPGDSYRDEGLDLTAMYKLPSGRYAVRAICDDPPLMAISNTFYFDVKRVKRGW